MKQPDYFWNLAPFVGAEFKGEHAHSFSELGVDFINRYKPGSVQFVNLNGLPVLRRTMSKGEIGASGDFWFVQPHYDPTENTYTTQVFLRFEKDFFEKTRAGKLPLSFHSKQGVAVGSNFPPNNQPDGFALLVMFYVDRDVQGNVVPAKQWGNREKNTAAIGDFTYGYGIPRKNGKYANQELWKWDNGKGVRLTEESWWGVTRVVKLNDIGASNGYIRSYVANMDATGGDWKLVGDRSNLQIRKDAPMYMGDFPIFQGGGNKTPVPEGYGPLGDVVLYATGFSTWKGEILPSGNAFTPDGLPILAFDPDNEGTEEPQEPVHTTYTTIPEEVYTRLTDQLTKALNDLGEAESRVTVQGNVIANLTLELDGVRFLLNQIKSVLSNY